MGWPVEHSLSPRLHGWWLKRYGIEEGSYTLLPVEPENLGEKLRRLAAEGFCGVNLTVPHKEAAMNLVDHLDATAQDVGAVNTVVVQARISRWKAATPMYMASRKICFRRGMSRAERPVVVLGAGGAARAAVAALNDMGVGEIRASSTVRAARRPRNRWRKFSIRRCGSFSTGTICHARFWKAPSCW